jgi:hypothetical protein
MAAAAPVKFDIEYKRQVEACGFDCYRCSFCQRSLDDEASIRLHISNAHSVVRLRYKYAAVKSICDRKRHHLVFPAWRRTSATDWVLREWLDETKTFCFVGAREIDISLLSVQCDLKNLHLCYCPLCHFETPAADTDLQREHFFETHVAFVARVCKSRLFYC